MTTSDNQLELELNRRQFLRQGGIGFGPIAGKVHVHDLHATLLHLLGFDHEQLTYRFQGRDYRLTDVLGKVVEEILI